MKIVLQQKLNWIELQNLKWSQIIENQFNEIRNV